MPQLKVAKLNGKPEIFYTLQGEGVNIGMPAVFIRSSLCNLHCTWCDTDYTWNWVNTPWKHENDSLTGFKKYEKSEYIVEPGSNYIVEKILSFKCQNLVITGGEPLLQQDAWCEILKLIREQCPDFRFEVETNGTIIPTKEFSNYIEQFNVSPKLANSGNKQEQRICNDTLDYFSKDPKAWFKFVVSDTPDLDEINNLIKDHTICPKKVLLMPEGRTRSALNKRRLWLAEICKTHGFRFGDRLHIRLWGGKRGI